jgi:hypothetical protein
MSLRVTISEGSGSGLLAAMRSLNAGGLASLHRAAGTEVQRITAEHIARLRRAPDSFASRLGLPTSGHYAQASEKVSASSALTSGAAGATLTISHRGFARAFRSLHIVPRSAKALAIPVHKLAAGHRAAELWDRMNLFIPKGSRVIAATMGGVVTPMYVLCRSVTQKQDRSLLPSDEAFHAAAVAGARGWLNMALRKGGQRL